MTERSALLLVDVVNELEFDGGDRLAVAAEPMADRLAELRRRSTAAGVPTIFVNDNFGDWRRSFEELVARVRHRDVRGRRLADTLPPGEDDYYILKPRHSGFYATALHELLEELEVRRVIVGGVQTHQCVMLTATDAHLRHYRVAVPEDGCAAESEEEHRRALALLRSGFRVDTSPTAELEL